ncbi:hypothetical protein E2C01_039431 [Portunus trituberculatus]|uniref:Uncharacterized protein n=1 Tax=Portunus trituberculatus TaxID=210409 RepID=A0A5B7FJP7_PORTR|nr:hypothetical protein [Portunus trituberculatus]
MCLLPSLSLSVYAGGIREVARAFTVSVSIKGDWMEQIQGQNKLPPYAEVKCLVQIQYILELVS